MLAPIAISTRRAPGRIEFSGERLVNYLFEQASGVSPGICLGREGYSAFATLDAGHPVRGITTMGGNLYASCGGALYKVTTAAAKTNVGSIADAHARMAANLTQVGIVANSTYYLCDGSTVTTPTVGALSGGVSDIAFADQYFFLSGDTGSRADAITVSALNDGSTFDPLDVAFSEDEPDSIVGVQKQGQYIWLLNEHSYEVFQNTGAAAFPWEPTGTFSGEDGCKSRESIVFTENTILWVRPDGAVMAAPDYVPQAVAPPEIKQIFQDTAVTDSFALTDRGHEVAVWRFASRPALVCDITSGFNWSEYSTGADVDSAFFVTCSVMLGGTEYFGTSTGKIVTRSRTVYQDDGAVISAQATSQPLAQPFQHIPVHQLIVQVQGSENAADGAAGEVGLKTTSDGRTWSNTLWRELGGAGVYYKEAVWNGLGSFRNRFQFQTTVTDDVPRDLYGAQIG